MPKEKLLESGPVIFVFALSGPWFSILDCYNLLPILFFQCYLKEIITYCILSL